MKHKNQPTMIQLSGKIPIFAPKKLWNSWPYSRISHKNQEYTPQFPHLANYLLGRHTLKRGTDDYGHAFEHLVVQEIIAYKEYNDKRDIISYWHTYDKKEVDIIIGDAKVAIEIKSSEHVENKHKKGLKAFQEEHPECRLIITSLDPITRTSGDIELIYVLDFLKMLWHGEIF